MTTYSELTNRVLTNAGEVAINADVLSEGVGMRAASVMRTAFQHVQTQGRWPFLLTAYTPVTWPTNIIFNVPESECTQVFKVTFYELDVRIVDYRTLMARSSTSGLPLMVCAIGLNSWRVQPYPIESERPNLQVHGTKVIQVDIDATNWDTAITDFPEWFLQLAELYGSYLYANRYVQDNAGAAFLDEYTVTLRRLAAIHSRNPVNTIKAYGTSY